MKKEIEAILFVSSEPISSSKIARILGIKVEDAEKILSELVQDYSSKDSSIEIVNFGNKYLMRVKPEYSEVVRSFTEREFEKGLLRTLAIIAIKQPIKLSDLAKIRGNRCYEHVKRLRSMGFISEEKKGRSTILRTTKNFAIYFGLKSSEPEEIKQTLMSIVKRDKKLEEYMDRFSG